MRLVRHQANDWGLDPKKIAILGFSAGGHLASSLSTHFDSGDQASADAIDRVPSRPDLSILLYPVITLSGPFAHMGSRQNLLGNEPSESLVDHLSSEKQVTPTTPPTFLFHCGEDKAVPLENSLLYASALRREGVPVELHAYQHGGHGMGLATDDPARSIWPTLCARWLQKWGWTNAGRE